MKENRIKFIQILIFFFPQPPNTEVLFVIGITNGENGRATLIFLFGEHAMWHVSHSSLITGKISK